MDLPLRKKVLFALIPSFALALLAIVGLEVWLRSRFESVQQITGVVAAWKLEGWRGLTYFWDQYHPTLGWTNVPGYESDAQVPFRLTINAQGLRGNRTYAASAPEGRPRALVFGDSTTFGEEVDDDATVPFHMERALAGVRGEVMNFGVHGYGLGQMVLRLEEEGFGFHPDHVVIVLLIPHDLKRDPLDEYTHPKPAFRLDGDTLVIGNTPVPEASRQPWWMTRSYATAWLFGRPKPLPPAGEDLQAYLDLAKALFARAQASCDEAGVPLTLAMIIDGNTLDAMAEDAEVSKYTERIRMVLGAAKGDVLDLVPALEAMHRRTQGGLRMPLGHWNGEANREIAGMVARHLALKNPAFRKAN